MDDRDCQIGTEEKIAAHRHGNLHRAFSIFVWDENNRLLLQRRAATKYHSPLLWSNTCCGHPRPGESLLSAAHRRLSEEMGFDCPLSRCASFTYRALLGSGLVEHEIDHILTGTFKGEPLPNPDEVDAWIWAEPKQLATDLAKNPESYSAWFGKALQVLGRLPRDDSSGPPPR